MQPIPPPEPGAPYVPYGSPNQRLMWGQTGSSRRLGAKGGLQRGLAADTSECFAYCAGDVGLPAPFYFSIKAGASGDVCLCSADGELVYGSGFQSYMATESGSGAPTEVSNFFILQKH